MSKNQRFYSWVFLDDNYVPVTTLKQIDRYGTRLVLFLNGKPIGSGELAKRKAHGKNNLNTTAVGLYRGFRNKGHGLELYRAFIEAAKTVGASRLYSDTHLNRFSRRMWKTKLSRLGYVVHRNLTCQNACRHCPRRQQFFIDL